MVLQLCGVSSAVEVMVNGFFIGTSKDSMMEAEFDITEQLQSATSSTSNTHVIALRVMQWSDGSYLEDQVLSIHAWM